MKLQSLFLTLLLAVAFISCKSDETDEPVDEGALINNIRFIPKSYITNSKLRIEWDTTNPVDGFHVNIVGNVMSSISTNTTSTAVNVNTGPDDYKIYIINSKSKVFGPFEYTYNPMPFGTRKSGYFSTDTFLGFTWKFDGYNEIFPYEFELKYGPHGFNPEDSGVLKVIYNTAQMISNQFGDYTIDNSISEEGGIYDFYIRSVYTDTGKSEWTGPHEINFPPAYLGCSVPIIDYINVTNGGTSVYISWNSSSNYSYELAFVSSITGNPDTSTTTFQRDNSEAYFNITQGTHYYFALRAKCSDDSFTQWSRIYDFVAN